MQDASLEPWAKLLRQLPSNDTLLCAGRRVCFTAAMHIYHALSQACKAGTIAARHKAMRTCGMDCHCAVYILAAGA